MDTGWIIGLVVGLLLGAATFAYGGFSLSDAHPFLAVLSYVSAVGCVTGAIALGILAPRKFEVERENKGLKEQIDKLTQENSKLRSAEQSLEIVPTVITPVNIPTVNLGPIETHVTPQYLVDLFKGRTHLQADKLVKEHIGKKIPISGKIQSVRITMSGNLIAIGLESSKSGPGATLFFEKEWNDRLSALHEGDQISAVGVLYSVDSTSVSLDRCELVSVQT